MILLRPYPLGPFVPCPPASAFRREFHQRADPFVHDALNHGANFESPNLCWGSKFHPGNLQLLVESAAVGRRPYGL